ncbi:MAG TPA: S-methyl-5-thioribose-1-phosphate isomerase [Methanoregula sp.]|nr:S-methyl-5-thioribose-1-phosphate isomerase [Methanoregula sp.]
MKDSPTLWWDEKRCSIRFIEQTLLPNEERIEECRTVERWATAIRRLEVRGAPALGVAGAYGVALAAAACTEKDLTGFRNAVCRDAAVLRETRPTAINLSWGIDRVLARIAREGDIAGMRRAAVDEAEAIAREDTACCHKIGKYGAELLPDPCTVLTHCNAGALACSSWGTALGVIRSAVEEGKEVRVIACETRPLLQGARLTAWELESAGIPHAVIADSAAASMMARGEVDLVVTGADRIARNGDTANKIGTYALAVLAAHHGIPLYVVAPTSTLDRSIATGAEIPIEERDGAEVTERFLARNPAFDVTPADLIGAIVTERGVHRPPYDQSLPRFGAPPVSAAPGGGAELGSAGADGGQGREA